jgi:hypothetical protein
VSTLAIVIAICIAVVLSIFVWSSQRAASRRRAIQQYADEHNFTFLGNILPDTLNLQASSLCRAENISSVFLGSGKKDIIFFDPSSPPAKQVTRNLC